MAHQIDVGVYMVLPYELRVSFFRGPVFNVFLHSVSWIVMPSSPFAFINDAVIRMVPFHLLVGLLCFRFFEFDHIFYFVHSKPNLITFLPQVCQECHHQMLSLITPTLGLKRCLRLDSRNASLTLWRIYGEWAYECSSP